MANNENLHNAKVAKNDEFYTQYSDIEREMNAYFEFDHDVFRGKTILLPCDDPEWSNFTKYFAANFERFGLKKLISTSYARSAGNRQISMFESSSPFFDAQAHETNGRIFVLDHDIGNDGKIDGHDITWRYLNGDGDFRSKEVTALRDESDVVITNGPFSLFREFLAWIEPQNRQFIIMGNQNAVTYKEVFPLIKDNKIWLGPSIHSGGIDFVMPDDLPAYSQNVRIVNGKHVINLAGIRWFTNIDHGLRHTPMNLMSMHDNLVYNKKLRKVLIEKYGQSQKSLHYEEYDNYNAIEVPFTDAIPSDWDGAIGAPITFLDRYCPSQFSILNANDFRRTADVPEKPTGLIKDKEGVITLDKPSCEADATTDRQTDRQLQSMRESAFERELLSPGADGWHIHGKRIYARIFIRKL